MQGKGMSMKETSASILRYWFGEHEGDVETAQAQAPLWWKKSEQVDEEIKNRFAQCVVQAGAGGLDAWADEPHARLALILLCDQFTRHIYRDTPQAFSLDYRALGWAREGLALKADQALRPIEQVFFYLPLEHSESISDQDDAVRLFEQLKANAPVEAKDAFDGFLDYALRHREIIVRFGRFPHRNAALGRPSTEEEIAFLKQPGSSF
jgi:uncharacterized protein (DUF924 family)